jgi:holo-[acyl-carrier protein] synthase
VSDAKQDCRATATVAIARRGRRSASSTTPGPIGRSNKMSVIGIGVDVIECSRIQRSIERFGDRFLHRVFTDGEIEYSMSMKFPERHLAARFAGKEAVAKAFGTGIGKAMGWRNIDIQKRKSGEPFLVFSGPAEAFAAERGVISALITLSHTENYAVACAVLQG